MYSKTIPLTDVAWINGDEGQYSEVGDSDVKYSLADSDGKQLTKEQSEYFKDSKMRDENGNLKVMYHGSQDAGFHIFDSSMSDDDTSFFFVDRNDVAASYSGTYETYEAKAFKTAEDANNFFSASVSRLNKIFIISPDLLFCRSIRCSYNNYTTFYTIFKVIGVIFLMSYKSGKKEERLKNRSSPKYYFVCLLSYRKSTSSDFLF